MNNRVSVSVVIATYNRAGFLKTAIDSVLSQTYPATEVIIVDDGSTDNTRDIVKNFGTAVRYYWQSNKGAATARNFGIKNATCDYIAFLDSDDYWESNKLEEQISLMKSNDEYNGICSSALSINDDGIFVGDKKPGNFLDATLEGFIKSHFVVFSSSLLERQAVRKVGGFDPKLRVAEDYDFFLRFLTHFKIVFLDKPLVFYRRSNDSKSKDKISGYEARIYALKKVFKSDLTSKIKISILTRIGECQHCLSREHLIRKDFLRFVKYYIFSKIMILRGLIAKGINTDREEA